MSKIWSPTSEGGQSHLNPAAIWFTPTPHFDRQSLPKPTFTLSSSTSIFHVFSTPLSSFDIQPPFFPLNFKLKFFLWPSNSIFFCDLQHPFSFDLQPPFFFWPSTFIFFFDLQPPFIPLTFNLMLWCFSQHMAISTNTVCHSQLIHGFIQTQHQHQVLSSFSFIELYSTHCFHHGSLCLLCNSLLTFLQAPCFTSMQNFWPLFV